MIQAPIRHVREDIATAFASLKEYDLVTIDTTRLDGKLRFLLEVAGPVIFPANNFEMLQVRPAEQYRAPMVPYARRRTKTVRGPQGRCL